MNGEMPVISVLIPTLNAAKLLPMQLAALHAQTVKIAEIVIIDSQSDDDTCAIATADSLCRVIPIKQADFDHDGTRDEAARTCKGSYLWFLTQDAIPEDERCLEALLEALSDNHVAAAFARQIAPESADRMDQLHHQFNYPPISATRNAKDIPVLQVRAFFMSNTCCLYRRDAYVACGGFQRGLPTNEDMLLTAAFLRNGYKTAYCADACVWHLHHITPGQWYRCSFDQGAVKDIYGQQIDGVRSYGEGRRYVVVLLGQLLREGRLLSAVRFGMICVARLLGDYAGHRHMRYSLRTLLRCT